ncbi:DUF169 domain-containing protein [Methanobacterium sp. ACI-7]|uniref:DUF169 domain-containing protein n=1 Tax=unclassified Methanobacterium TaxID=2627676 RepID=UPI0039C062F2
MSYGDLVKELNELIGLKGSPVAVKLVKNAEEIPEDYEKVGEKKRHCEFVQDARLKGNKGYATSEEHLCKGGAGVMGIEALPENVASGGMYYKLGNFETSEGARDTVNAIPKVEEKYYASLYAPLECAEFDPDVIVLILTPKQALKVSQAYLRKKGGRISNDYSGIQSVCADAVAAVKERGIPNMTLGCNGSRKFAEIADEEVIIGLPPEKLEDIVEALKIFKEKWG